MTEQATQTMLFFSALLVSGSITYISLREFKTVYIEKRLFINAFLMFAVILVISIGFWFLNIWVFTVVIGILFGVYSSLVYVGALIRQKERDEKYKNG